MNPFSVGARVRVKIQDPSEYATGCAKCLDGKTGTVDEVRDNGNETDRKRPQVFLVLFDTPAAKWWAHQTPARAFWFEAKDLAPYPADEDPFDKTERP